LKRNTAETLKLAEQDLLATQQQIAGLQQEYDAKKLDGDPAELERLQRGIQDLDRRLKLYSDRIALLQPILEQEQAEQKKRQRQQAIAKAEQLLPQRQAAVFALGRWLKDGLPLIEQFKAASKLPGWPDGLERPYAEDVQPGRFLRAIAAALSDFGEDWSPVERI
jgi:hypothetical protein